MGLFGIFFAAAQGGISSSADVDVQAFGLLTVPARRVGGLFWLVTDLHTKLPSHFGMDPVELHALLERYRCGAR